MSISNFKSFLQLQKLLLIPKLPPLCRLLIQTEWWKMWSQSSEISSLIIMAGMMRKWIAFWKPISSLLPLTQREEILGSNWKSLSYFSCCQKMSSIDSSWDYLVNIFLRQSFTNIPQPWQGQILLGKVVLQFLQPHILQECGKGWP